MIDGEAELEWLDEPAATTTVGSSSAAPFADCERLAWRRWWVIPLLFSLTAIIEAGLLILGRNDPQWGIVAALIGCLLGLGCSLAAQGWAVAIVFAESPRKGAWFVFCPPYMLYYCIVRCRWMAQPTVLLLCGLTLAFGTVYGIRWLQGGS
jgi:hypothetical protein